MADIISFINMKGGVGKTTLSIGIADYLSSIGKKYRKKSFTYWCRSSIQCYPSTFRYL